MLYHLFLRLQTSGGKPLSYYIMHGASLNYAEGQFTSPYFQLTFIFKMSYATINLRMTVSDKSEGIWMYAMVAYFVFVLPEDGRHRLQRISVIT